MLLDNDNILADYNNAGGANDGDLGASGADGDTIGAVLDLGAGTKNWTPGEPVVVLVHVIQALTSATGTTCGVVIKSDSANPPTTEVGRTPYVAKANYPAGAKFQVLLNDPGRYVEAELLVNAATDWDGILQITVLPANDVQSNVGGLPQSPNI